MKKRYTYKNRGTCSSEVSFSLEDGVISEVSFRGGCNGNLQGLSKLAEGMNAEELTQRLSGIRCGMKPTSCPDQLAKAVTAALSEEAGA